VPNDFSDKDWLGTLVAAELERHEPATVRARLVADLEAAAEDPVDLAAASRLLVARSLRAHRLTAQAPAEVFRETVRQHVALLLDLAVLRHQPFDHGLRRAEAAAFLAAALGEDRLALSVAPGERGGSPRAVERALRGAAERLRARFFPPGDPVSGLPLYPGSVAVLRRRLARVSMGHARAGRLEPEALERHATYAARELVLLTEILAGLFLASDGLEERATAVRMRQLSRLGLEGTDLREARARLGAPRPPETVALAAPDGVRPFLLEQIFLAQPRARIQGDGVARNAAAFAGAASLDAETVVAAQVEAAAQARDHQSWFEAIGDGAGPTGWQSLADQWEAVADTVVERVSTAVTENLGALATELRQTGELGTLLAKAAGGNSLTRNEKAKVRAQLIDLAKAVPALAIFAAPGGAILLPVLAKLLPFNLLPSAWDRSAAARGAKRVVAGPVVAGPVVAGPVVAGPVVAGPVVAGPVVAGPVVAGPDPTGGIAAGPVAAGAVVTGPVAAKPIERVR
jgi:hypothetical protein